MDEALMIPMMEEYARTKDLDLRDRLFDGFFPLAKAIARRFSGRGVDVEDLEQVAGIALLKAMERFEPERGYRFVTYAVPTITGDVRNYLRDKAGGLRVPRDTRQKLYRMQQARERFSQTFLREPTAKELACEMEITPDELLWLLQLRDQSEVTSLDAKVGEEESEFASFLGRQEPGYDRIEADEWMQWLYSKVNDKERELLSLRYKERLGQRETARRLGISQMHVSRMERRILERLRAIEQSGA